MKTSNVVFEDATQAYNRWTQGIATRELHASKIDMNTILGDTSPKDLNQKFQFKPLHPALASAPAIVGNVLVSLQNLRQNINIALSSNLGRIPAKREALLALRKKVINQINIIKTFRADFDKIS